MLTCTTGLRPVDPDPQSRPEDRVASGGLSLHCQESRCGRNWKQVYGASEADGTAGGLAAGAQASGARPGEARGLSYWLHRGAGLLACAAALVACTSAQAETGVEAWLRYAPLDEPALTQYRQAVPATVLTLSNDPLQLTARDEVIRGIRGMLGRTLRIAPSTPAEPSIQIGTLAQLHLQATLAPESYWLKSSGRNILIAGADDRGVLYGAFALLRKIALGEPIANLDEKQSPRIPIRWVNQWDNLDGTIERGYGGRSIFWENLHARADLSRAADYGRLLASLGINGCSINNVNANPRVLAPDFIPRDRAHRRRLPSLGRARRHRGRFRQPQDHRRPRHFRSARSQSRRLVGGQSRRDLQAPFPISAASCSRPIPKAAWVRPPMAAPTPTPPTS